MSKSATSAVTTKTAYEGRHLRWPPWRGSAARSSCRRLCWRWWQRVARASSWNPFGTGPRIEGRSACCGLADSIIWIGLNASPDE